MKGETGGWPMTKRSEGNEFDPERREVWDRRDTGFERRQTDRRRDEKRRGERRAGGRRKDFCTTCEGELTPTAYCPVCKVRVIKFRAGGGR